MYIGYLGGVFYIKDVVLLLCSMLSITVFRVSMLYYYFHVQCVMPNSSV